MRRSAAVGLAPGAAKRSNVASLCTAACCWVSPVAFCAAVGAVSLHLMLDGAWALGAGVGVAAAVAATIGDLMESLLKRDVGIKDMSSILPGHGGVMDRLDSLVMTAPLVWALLTYLLPGAT